MNLDEVTEKAWKGPLKGWFVNGAGEQIRGIVPEVTPCVEFDLKAGEQVLFSGPFIQFAPQEWVDRQTATAQLLAHWYNHGPEIANVMESLAVQMEAILKLFPPGHPVREQTQFIEQAQKLLKKVNEVE